MRFIFPVIANLAILTLSACSQVNSEDLKTSGMRAVINVEATSSIEAEVEVKIEAGSGGNGSDVELTGGDTLTASTLGTSQRLRKSENIFNEIVYKTTFEGIVDDAEYIISFDREDGVSAPDSSVFLPLSFDITAPANGDDFDNDDIITVTWDANPVDESIERRLITTCENDSTSHSDFDTDDIADDGEFSLVVEDLIINTEVDDPLECEITIELVRHDSGDLDPAFGEGGYIRATQKRDIKLYLNP